MAKEMLSEVKRTTQKQVTNKIRKVLQTLQASADEEELTRNMFNPNDKELPCKEKQPKSSGKLKLPEKENAPAVRRSKRKNATVTAVNYAESPEVSKAAKSVKSVSNPKKTVKSKKGTSTAGKKNEQTKIKPSNQTKLQFSPVATVTALEENPDGVQSDNPEKIITSVTDSTEDSGFDPNCGVSDQSPINSTAIKSPSKSCIIPEDISMITADVPPLNYWKTLAEQRRIALEKALHENELLHDQLSVLEAENSQLKQLVKYAELVTQALQDTLE